VGGGRLGLDLVLGYKTRPHADLEISMLACDQQALFDHLRGWDLRLAAPGQSSPRWDGSRIRSPFHQVWARRGPGRPSTPEEFAADPTMLGFLLEQSRTEHWVFRRHHGVSRLLHQVGVVTADGVPVVAPEIALLFKAKAPRFKDQRDFDRVLPHLDRAARSWLASALEQPTLATPGTPGCSASRHECGPRDYDSGHDEWPLPMPSRASCTWRTARSWPRAHNSVVWHYAV
jgi:hypothetical protein